jgi:hypothetical protein
MLVEQIGVIALKICFDFLWAGEQVCFEYTLKLKSLLFLMDRNIAALYKRNRTSAVWWRLAIGVFFWNKWFCR